MPTPASRPRGPMARPFPSPRSVPDLLEEALASLTATTRQRDLRVEVDCASDRRSRDYATLRRALLLFLADTVETAIPGGRIVARVRDLAGGRVGIAFEDDSGGATLIERAREPPDRSGRATSLRDTIRDLERDHAARIAGSSEPGSRRLLMDVAFADDDAPFPRLGASGGVEFDELVEEIVREEARRRPAWATSEGLRGFDHALADPSPEAIAADAARLARWIDRLDRAVDAPSVDRDAVRAALAVDLFAIERLTTWSKNPDFATEIMDHVFPLLVRTERPLEERAAAMASRLARARAFLSAARRRIEPSSVPPLWVGIAIESVDQAPAFLDAALAATAGATPATRARLDRAARDALAAFAEHRMWLTRDLAPVAAGEWAIGRDAFEALLVARLLPFGVDELWSLGHELVARHRADLADAALAVLATAGMEPGDEPVRRALDVVRRDRPSSFGGVLDAYRETIRAARAFVLDHGIATIPAGGDAPLDVMETPAYLRHLIPFAAYVQPARFDRDSRGTYLVTPKVDLSDFPIADVRNTTVHEAYPGHHLHFSVARTHPSAGRVLASAPETIEGWALYAEVIMGRHGFTSSPTERFVRARDAHWRAVRVVLDVGMHTGRTSFGEAVRMLVVETAMSGTEAEAEARRYTLSPGYNMSYLLGRIMIERLRSEWEVRPGFVERAFHDAILSRGPLPLPLVAREVSEILSGVVPTGPKAIPSNNRNA